MECSCQINVGFDDECEMLSAMWVVSKSANICGECGLKIKPGVKYLREQYVDNGEKDTCKTCSDCLSIRQNLCGDWIYTAVRETVSDAIADGLEIPEKCIAKLTPDARAWVCELIEKEWEVDE